MSSSTPKTSRIGEINPDINAIIIAYRNAHDIDVKFLNTETILHHKEYKAFKRGEIKDPALPYTANIKSERLGETKENIYGEQMEIVAYRKSDDIDVKIKGEILTHKDYRYFLNGTLHSSKVNPQNDKHKMDRLGEEYIFPNGDWMRIIEYFDSQNITVLFSDGTTCPNKSYANFVKGTIGNPNKQKNKRIGEKKKNNSGEEMEIISYTDYDHITVRFTVDGSTVYTSYNSFRLGKIIRPTLKNVATIGETHETNQGLTAKIIEITCDSKLTIRIEETGEIIKNRNYRDFLNGSIFSKKQFESLTLHKKVRMKNGLTAEIIEYRRSTDCDFLFEDNTIVQNKNSRYLKNGGLTHPNLSLSQKSIFHGFQTQLAWIDEDVTYYKCKCLSCNAEPAILTPQEMLEHEKTHK